jgi:hypothetical protein
MVVNVRFERLKVILQWKASTRERVPNVSSAGKD